MLTHDLMTSKLLLSCLREEHATDEYRAWMMDPEVNQYLETRFSPPTVESLRDYIASVRESVHSYLFGIFSKVDGAHFGNIKLGPVSAVHSSASIGLMIGDRAAWGRGIATEAITGVSEWGFVALELHKLTAGSYRRNSGSVRAFEKSGYQVEGVQRSQVRLVDGGRDDVVLLGRLRPDAEHSVD